jgi:hypothetical protein
VAHVDDSLSYMDADSDLRISRSRLYVDGVEKGGVKKIGKGAFAVAYMTTDTKKPRVLLVVREDDAGDYSKSALFELNRDGNGSTFLPKVTRAGWMGDTPVYEMPLYRAPLRKSDSPKAWAQYRVLKRCWDSTEDAMREKLGWKEASNPHHGHVQMDGVIACARRDKAVTPALVKALKTLQSYMADYGADYRFEFSPRNLATTANGRLILLDTTFSMEALNRQRAAARKKHRGW